MYQELEMWKENQLHNKAIELMEKLDNKYNRETAMSLDEYQLEFEFTNDENVEISNLIQQF